MHIIKILHIDIKLVTTWKDKALVTIMFQWRFVTRAMTFFGSFSNWFCLAVIKFFHFAVFLLKWTHSMWHNLGTLVSMSCISCYFKRVFCKYCQFAFSHYLNPFVLESSWKCLYVRQIYLVKLMHYLWFIKIVEFSMKNRHLYNSLDVQCTSSIFTVYEHMYLVALKKSIWNLYLCILCLAFKHYICDFLILL